MAYTERRERGKGTRYRGIYKAADGRYRTAGTFDTAERALESPKRPRSTRPRSSLGQPVALTR